MHRIHAARPSLAVSARRTARRWLDAYLSRGFDARVVVGPNR